MILRMAASKLLSNKFCSSVYRAQPTTKMNWCQTKISAAVHAAVCLVAVGCVAEDQETTKSGTGVEGKPVAPGVLEVGHISHPRITEGSGLVASRQFPGVLWTHND